MKIVTLTRGAWKTASQDGAISSENENFTGALDMAFAVSTRVLRSGLESLPLVPAQTCAQLPILVRSQDIL